jgi:XTP/dITP diphosphohydrolase
VARQLRERRLVVASHNPGKVAEIRDLLAPYGIETLSAAEVELPEPEETGDTFVDNALLKARAGASGADMVALADDSGLQVSALDGAPGLFSARWAGPGRDFDLAMTRVEKELSEKGGKGEKNRAACFVAALALCWPDGHTESFEGRVYGHLVWPPRGGRGFGYDPMFQPDGHDITFGEMDPAEKHRISHRAVAFAKLLSACLDGVAGHDAE